MTPRTAAVVSTSDPGNETFDLLRPSILLSLFRAYGHQ